LIKFKVVKPGKGTFLAILAIGIISLFVIYRSFLFAYSSVEVFSPSNTSPDSPEDSNRVVSTVLKATLERAFPLMAVKKTEENNFSFLRGIVELVTRLNYRDPKSFIMAQLPIMGNYDIPIASRGGVSGHAYGNPYDPEEDLNEILRQYNPEQVQIGPVISDDQQALGTRIEKPEKTRLDMNMPLVLIYHTHTSEAYRPSRRFNYTPTDVDRTIDPRYSVVRVGKELKEELESKYGIKVVHVTTFHDYPDYSPSYARSLNSVKSALATYPTIKIILDIHRDAFPMRNKAEIAIATSETTMEVDGKNIARIMLVWGPDAENSAETRKFAELLKNKINERVPGLCRKVLEKPRGKYNQQLSSYSSLIEVGSNANTMEEALNSIPYLAEAVAKTIKEIGE
jgi:stage II sporulation protein P